MAIYYLARRWMGVFASLLTASAAGVAMAVVFGFALQSELSGGSAAPNPNAAERIAEQADSVANSEPPPEKAPYTATLPATPKAEARIPQNNTGPPMDFSILAELPPLVQSAKVPPPAEVSGEKRLRWAWGDLSKCARKHATKADRTEIARWLAARTIANRPERAGMPPVSLPEMDRLEASAATWVKNLERMCLNQINLVNDLDGDASAGAVIRSSFQLEFRASMAELSQVTGVAVPAGTSRKMTTR